MFTFKVFFLTTQAYLYGEVPLAYLSLGCYHGRLYT